MCTRRVIEQYRSLHRRGRSFAQQRSSRRRLWHVQSPSRAPQEPREEEACCGSKAVRSATSRDVKSRITPARLNWLRNPLPVKAFRVYSCRRACKLTSSVRWISPRGRRRARDAVAGRRVLLHDEQGLHRTVASGGLPQIENIVRHDLCVDEKRIHGE